MGAGKSLVLKFLKNRGVPVLQTDLLGHQLLRDKKFSKILLEHFGREILGERGQIDRAKLGRIVFEKPGEQKKLNALMHPKIRKKVTFWVRKHSEKSRPPAIVVVEVPLLFERGFYHWFDGSLCVSAPGRLRQERLLKRGWTLQEIRWREKFQWPQGKKDRKADWVIYNQGAPKDLKYAVDRWLETMKVS